MATVEELVARGDLVQVSNKVLRSDQLPERVILLTGRAEKWMKEVLPSLETDGYVDGALTPKQQAFDLFRCFIAGDDLFASDWYPKPLRPFDQGHGVWELRTPDLRFFGWFVSKGTFVVSAVGVTEEVKDHQLYTGYRNQAVFDRESLELDHPAFVLGGSSDVF